MGCGLGEQPDSGLEGCRFAAASAKARRVAIDLFDYGCEFTFVLLFPRLASELSTRLASSAAANDTLQAQLLEAQQRNAGTEAGRAALELEAAALRSETAALSDLLSQEVQDGLVQSQAMDCLQELNRALSEQLEGAQASGEMLTEQLERAQAARAVLTEELGSAQAAGAALKEQMESAQAAWTGGERDAAAAMASSQAAAAVALEQALAEVEAERQLCQTLREELADMFEALGSAQEELTAAESRAFELEARFQASSLELVGAQQQLEQSLIASRALNGQMEALSTEVAAQHLAGAAQQEARLQQAQSELEQVRSDLEQSRADLGQARLARDQASAEVVALGGEEHLLKAQNESLMAELDELKADFEAFVVENEQLSEQVMSRGSCPARASHAMTFPSGW